MSDLILRTPCEHCDNGSVADRPLPGGMWSLRPCDTCNGTGGSETALDPDTVIRRINDGWGHDYNLTVADVLTTLTAALQGDS